MMHVRAFFVIIAAMVIPPAACAQIRPGGASGSPGLAWRRIADLPEPGGLKGMYGGVSGGHVLLAGGSNFPVPQREGGSKKFHRAIFIRSLTADPTTPWITAEEHLPGNWGEGASVTTPEGIVCVGGNDGVAALATVFLITWNAANNRVACVMLPDLPEAAANAAAAGISGWVYVAGGDGAHGALKTFWRLNVAGAIMDPSGTRWESLPAWPGRPRFGGILSPVSTRRGDGLLWSGGMEGPAKSQADYLRDAHVYLPEERKWVAAAAMPRGAVLGAVARIDAAQVLVLGGSDGHDFERMKDLGERYRIPDGVLAYNARTDRWSVAGEMPLGLVGAAVVRTSDGWIVAGGEYSPGLRTAQVHELRVGESPAAPR